VSHGPNPAGRGRQRKSGLSSQSEQSAAGFAGNSDFPPLQRRRPKEMVQPNERKGFTGWDPWRAGTRELRDQLRCPQCVLPHRLPNSPGTRAVPLRRLGNACSRGNVRSHLCRGPRRVVKYGLGGRADRSRSSSRRPRHLDVRDGDVHHRRSTVLHRPSNFARPRTALRWSMLKWTAAETAGTPVIPTDTCGASPAATVVCGLHGAATPEVSKSPCWTVRSDSSANRSRGRGGSIPCRRKMVNVCQAQLMPRRYAV